MKTSDGNSEVYNGKLPDKKAHFDAPDRITWIYQRTQGSRVLDIGCSKGIASILLARADKNVTRIDSNRDSIEYCREELAAESDSTRERLTLIHGDALQQAFQEHSFDTVLMGQLIEHVPEPEAFLELARRVCKPNGRVIITTPFGLPEHPEYERIFYLYRFAVLVSHFYKFKELDIVGKYIAFSGEPLKTIGTGLSKMPLVTQEWHRRIHQVSERKFEQIEMKQHMTLLAQSSIIKAFENRIQGLRSDRQALQSTIEALQNRIEGLRKDRQTLQNRIIRLREKIEAMRASVAFRVGEVLVSAVRPSKATIALPFGLWRIYRDYRSKKPHP
jgi:2-polyprenyl-6-hydroxyphenyl methylase/3-demethylubiquinone-9 3-methyltransferase